MPISRVCRALMWTLASVPLTAFAPRPAAACSVCLAGDPSFEATGTSVGQAGEWNLFVQASGWEKKSGSLPHHEEGEEEEEHAHGSEKAVGRRIDAYLGWTPLDRVTLTLNVPFVFNKITEFEEGDKSRASLAGFGDLSLMASGVLWRNRDVLPDTWLEARAFLKAPTGKSETRAGGVEDPHLQRGTGSWDFGFGLAAAHKLELASLYASASYRVNSEGSLHYEYGDYALVNAALLVPLGHATKVPGLDPFTAGFELNFRWAQKDVSDGEDYDDSGGSILYATPSLRVALSALAFGERPAPSLRLAIEVPFTSAWLHGFQREDPLWRIGLLVPF
jgi:hypothetical protein